MADFLDFVSADGPYMRLHVGDREFLIRERMHALEKRLGTNGFLRIHPSTVVNLERVIAIEPYFRGEAFVRLRVVPSMASSAVIVSVM